MLFKFATLLITSAAFAAGQTDVIADFDEEIVSPRAAPFPVGTYKGLSFGNFYYENPHDAKGNVPYGLRPSSGSNVALYYTPAVKSASLPVIKIAQSPDSDITFFDLNSFKFGCAVGHNGVAFGVSKCHLAVFGYRDGARVATQAFTFAPKTRGPTADLLSVTLSADFQTLDTVRFATTYAPISTSYTTFRAKNSGFTGSTWFDDIDFTVYDSAATTPETSPISTTGRCGTEFGLRCPANKCCSSFGYCSPLIEPGLDVSQWCAPEVCQVGWGLCDL